MRLVLHLMKKDLRRLRLDLLAYAAFLAVVATALTNGFNTSPVVWAWCLGLQSFMIVAIAAQTIQFDPLIGTSAFWKTRPIPRATLLAAKVGVAAAALIVVPAAVTAVIGRYNGLLWTDVATAFASALVGQAIIVVPVLVAAAFTSTLTQLVMVGLAICAASLVLHSTIAESMDYRAVVMTSGPSLHASRTIATWAVFLIGTSIVLPTHALTLKMRRAVVVAVVVHLLFIGVRYSWAWDFLERNEPTADPAIINPTNVRLSFHPNRVLIGPSMTLGGMRKGEQHVSVGLSWSGVPQNVVVVPVKVRATFRDQTGTVWDYERAPAWPLRSFAPLTEQGEAHRAYALAAALGGVRWLNVPSGGNEGYMAPVLELPQVEFDQINGKTGTLSVQLELRAARYQVVSKTPADTGARLTGRGLSSTIEQVSLLGSQGTRWIVVETHETRVARPPLDPQFSSHIVVHHPTRREALYADVAPQHRALLLQFPVLLPYHLEVGAALLQTRVSTDLQLDQSWLNDAELVRVEPVALGRFSLSLTIDAFTVKATMR